MNTLKGIGSVANGWLKFTVALMAIGWFGLQAVDRLAPPSNQQEVSVPSPDDSMFVSSEIEAKDETDGESTYTSTSLNTSSPTPRVAPTTFGTITKEIKSGANSFFGMAPTQLTLALLTGLMLGLFGRPGFDWIVEKRRVAAARKRMRLYERDQQLLAKAALRDSANPNPPSDASSRQVPAEHAVSPQV